MFCNVIRVQLFRLNIANFLLIIRYSDYSKFRLIFDIQNLIDLIRYFFDNILGYFPLIFKYPFNLFINSEILYNI